MPETTERTDFDPGTEALYGIFYMGETVDERYWPSDTSARRWFYDFIDAVMHDEYPSYLTHDDFEGWEDCCLSHGFAVIDPNSGVRIRGVLHRDIELERLLREEERIEDSIRAHQDEANAAWSVQELERARREMIAERDGTDEAPQDEPCGHTVGVEWSRSDIIDAAYAHCLACDEMLLGVTGHVCRDAGLVMPSGGTTWSNPAYFWAFEQVVHRHMDRRVTVETETTTVTTVHSRVTYDAKHYARDGGPRNDGKGPNARDLRNKKLP